MSRVILICGKICSGKSRYAASLAEEYRAVRLSCDDLMYALYRHQEGADFDEIAGRVKAWLHKTAIDTARAGANVVLDWGFWFQAERREVTARYRDAGVEVEWHYVDVTEAQWQANIRRRNEACRLGTTTDYPVDAGLLAKLQSRFQPPEREEIDVWHVNG